MPRVYAIEQRISDLGRDAQFFNLNAADDEKRKECVEQIRQRLIVSAFRVVGLHVLAAFGGEDPMARDVAPLGAVGVLHRVGAAGLAEHPAEGGQMGQEPSEPLSASDWAISRTCRTRRREGDNPIHLSPAR